ncbi:MATE family efflux transporter [Candidatus Bipolaricaulota bacterium]|nr:MATE family efflux transporter [Candidatus Bipolaricaulota bacterium]
MRERILEGPILKTMVILAWPVMVSNALQALYNLIDAFWLGKVSTEALSAPTVAWPVIFTFMSLGIGFQMAGSTLVAQHTGAGDKAGADRAGTQVFSFLFFLACGASLVGFLLAPGILRLMRTPADVYPLAVSYLRIVAAGFPVMFGAFAFTGLLLGVGDTRTPMYLMGASVLANAVLDPLLIFGWGPFPELGVAGAAYATVASRGVAALIGVWLLSTGRVGIRLRGRWLLPRWRWIKQILVVGGPNAIGLAGTSLGFVVLMGLVAGYGTTVVAAYGVGQRLIHLIHVAIWGATTALLTMVGQNLGADQLDRAEEIARRGIRGTFGVLAVLALVTVLLRVPLYRVFIADPAVIREGSRFMAIFGPSVPFFGLFAAASSVFRGSGHTVPPMVASLIRLWGSRIFLSWLLGYVVGLGPVGLWLGMTLSNVVGGLLLYGWLLRGTWKRGVIEVEAEAVPCTRG